MSSYAEICVLTAALCADALAASFIYGADRVKIPPCSALIIYFPLHPVFICLAVSGKRGLGASSAAASSGSLLSHPVRTGDFQAV